MSVENLESAISRLFFFGAFVLLALAIAERIVHLWGYTIVPMIKAETMLGMATVLLVFVIAIQLREIREAIKRQS